MRFYSERHEFYLGIDLHAREMFACVLNCTGEVFLDRNMKAIRDHLESLVQRFPGEHVIAVECIFTWYWIAGFCDERHIPLVLGHALYMKAIKDAVASRKRSFRPAHSGKSKNEKIDSQKITTVYRSEGAPAPGGASELTFIALTSITASYSIWKTKHFRGRELNR